MNQKFDLDATSSRHSGIKGIFEKALRRFSLGMQIVLMMPIYAVAAMALGVSLAPGVAWVRWVVEYTTNWSLYSQNIAIGISMAMAYFMYGFSLVFIVPILNFAIQGYLKPWRGPYFSIESLKWFLHNGLTYLVRFTFLEFLTPTPLNGLFYKMMGMQIGRGVTINTTWISDPSLIELGDKVTLGGSVTIVGHYGQGGLLVIAPVKIGKGVTVGLKATIMGGAVIGDGAKILPHSIVLPKTQIPAGETWGGVPAAPIVITRKNIAA